jgi:membrane protein
LHLGSWDLEFGTWNLNSIKVKQSFLTLITPLKKITLPGLGGVPLWEVLWFLYQKMITEAITVRAAAIAYSFFISLFPTLIFIFTLIPYIPVKHLQTQILQFMSEFLPTSAFETIEATLKDILLHRRGGLLSFGFISALYFASNGTKALLQAFHPFAKIRYWKRIVVANFLTLLIAFLVILALIITVGGSYMLSYLYHINFFKHDWVFYLKVGFRYVTIIALAITAISVLYYAGAAKGERFRLYSPGAFLATFFIALTSWGFGFYVEHFGRYNRVYGSLGTIIILLIWFYMNSMVLLAGFDFNQSVMKLRNRNKNIAT